jgi:hypothetical protein
MGTPVSGPGPYSKRTDTAVSNANNSLPNAKYGEAAAYEEQRTGAPVAKSEGVPQINLADMFAGMGQNVTPLSAESAQPDVPVTDGAAMGPGAGLDALGTAPPDPAVQRQAMYLPVWEFLANQPGSGDSARNLIRQIKAQNM